MVRREDFTMTKKVIYRSGVIPYFVSEHDNEIYMLFMRPSEPKFGGDTFQISKGKHEIGETAEEAAFREAREELGLFEGNVRSVHELGTFLGRTTIFLAEIHLKDWFGDPHFETAETKWMTPQQFYDVGRVLHKPIVKAAVRRIELEEKNKQTEWKPQGIPLTEVLDYSTKITWQPIEGAHGLRGRFSIDNHPFFVDLEDITIPIPITRNVHAINLSFAALDEKGDAIYQLQNWKVSPFRVLGAVWKGYHEKQQELPHEILLLGVSNKYGDVSKRMQLYNFIARRYMKEFGIAISNVRTRSGVVTILIDGQKTTDEEQTAIHNYVKKQVELK